MKTKTKAGEVDRIIGQRIKLKRKSLKISQEELGNAIGVSFQQVQKYEKGHNRISVGTIISISNYLGQSPLYFMRGYVDDFEGKKISYGDLSHDSKEILELYNELNENSVKQLVKDIIRSMVRKEINE